MVYALPNATTGADLWVTQVSAAGDAGVAAPLANVPKDYEARLVKMDFATTAANRERVLAEWTRRYDSKTEQKK